MVFLWFSYFKSPFLVEIHHGNLPRNWATQATAAAMALVPQEVANRRALKRTSKEELEELSSSWWLVDR